MIHVMISPGKYRPGRRALGHRALVGFAALVIPFSFAPGVGIAAEKRPGAEFELAVTPFYQSDVDVAGGGEFSVSRALLRFDISHPVSRTASTGLSLKYDVQDYEFSGSGPFGGPGAWGDIQRMGLGIPFFIRFAEAWTFGATPSLDFLRESGADLGDSLSYGTTIFAFRSIGPHQRLGFGAGLFRDVDDETRFFPVIAVDWRFNDRWRLANPFSAEALGPAGLELSYRFSELWQLGGGAVYRSSRFRLNDTGAAPGGTGENEGMVGFLRLRRTPGTGLNLDIYVGAILDGRLELEDSNKRTVATADYDSAPFAAVTMSAEF